MLATVFNSKSNLTTSVKHKINIQYLTHTVKVTTLLSDQLNE